LNRNPNKDKFQSRSKKGIFVGYAENAKAYRIWIPNEHRIDISRDVEFMAMPESSNHKGSDRNLNEEFTNDRKEVELSVNDGNNEDQEDKTNECMIKDVQSVEDRNEAQVPDLQIAAKRGRERPRKVMTGLKRRPRKQYQIAGNH